MSLLPSSPLTPKTTYVGDRFIPCRNTDKWDIQFNINEVCVKNNNFYTLSLSLLYYSLAFFASLE